MRLPILVSLLLFALATAAEPLETTAFTIKSRPAESLVDAVRPLLGEDGIVSAFDDRLIVRGTPAALASIRDLLNQIDRPARRLLIEVRNAAQASVSERNIGYGVNTGDIRLGRVPPGYEGQIGFQQIQTRGQADTLQRVQALDGQPALIRIGQSVPIYSVQSAPIYPGPQHVYGYGIFPGYSLYYRDTSQGFVALPRVHGDQVTVDIYHRDDRALASGAFAMQEASTVLQGPLGQWLTLGATGGEDSDRGDQIGRHISTRRTQDRRLELRVLVVD